MNKWHIVGGVLMELARRVPALVTLVVLAVVIIILAGCEGLMVDVERLHVSRPYESSLNNLPVCPEEQPSDETACP